MVLLKLLLLVASAVALAAAVVPNDVTYGTFPGYWSTTGGLNVPDADDVATVGTDLYILHRSGCIRKMTGPDAVSVFVGIPSYSVGPTIEGTGGAARLSWPAAMEAVSGSLIVNVRYCVLRVDLATAAVVLFAGALSTSGAVNGAGNVARFSQELTGVAVVGGNVVVADAGNHALRLIVNGAAGLTGAPSTRTVSTYAGLMGTSGDADGAAASARFNSPRWLRLNPTTQVVAAVDKGYKRVRFVSTAPSVAVTTAASQSLASATIRGIEWSAAGDTLFYVGANLWEVSHFATIDPTATLLAGSLAMFDFTDVKAVGLAARIYRGVSLRRVGAGSFLVGSQYTLNTITVV